MKDYRRQRCGVIDSRLLGELRAKYGELSHTQGAKHLAAVQAYLIALHHFTEVALRRLASLSGNGFTKSKSRQPEKRRPSHPHTHR